LQIVINKKLIDKYEEIVDIPPNTKALNFKPKEKLLKDIEKKYLE